MSYNNRVMSDKEKIMINMRAFIDSLFYNSTTLISKTYERKISISDFERAIFIAIDKYKELSHEQD